MFHTPIAEGIERVESDVRPVSPLASESLAGMTVGDLSRETRIDMRLGSTLLPEGSRRAHLPESGAENLSQWTPPCEPQGCKHYRSIHPFPEAPPADVSRGTRFYPSARTHAL